MKTDISRDLKEVVFQIRNSSWSGISWTDIDYFCVELNYYDRLPLHNELAPHCFYYHRLLLCRISWIVYFLLQCSLEICNDTSQLWLVRAFSEFWISKYTNRKHSREHNSNILTRTRFSYIDISNETANGEEAINEGYQVLQ